MKSRITITIEHRETELAWKDPNMDKPQNGRHFRNPVNPILKREKSKTKKGNGYIQHNHPKRVPFFPAILGKGNPSQVDR